jgi:hypothetical protein
MGYFINENPLAETDLGTLGFVSLPSLYLLLRLLPDLAGVAGDLDTGGKHFVLVNVFVASLSDGRRSRNSQAQKMIKIQFGFCLNFLSSCSNG